MKKSLNLLGLILGAAILVLAGNKAINARSTAPAATDADVWTAGPEGKEVVVDKDGNFLPTTDSDTTLGTSALRWATAYILDVVVGDDLTVAGDATVTGDILKTPIASAVLGAAGTIAVTGACGGVLQLTVTDDRTTNTTNTFTAPAAGNAGCRLDVINMGGGTITLDDNALFDVAANIVLGTGDSAEVVSTGAAWLLIGTSDN